MIYFVQNQNRKEKLNLISKNCPTSLSVKKRHISRQITVGQSGFPFLQKYSKISGIMFIKQVTVKDINTTLKPFCNIFGGHVLFVGPLVPLFWTSGELCAGFQSSCLHVTSPACHGFLRFTSGAKPANLLADSMAAEPL